MQSTSALTLYLLGLSFIRQGFDSPLRPRKAGRKAIARVNLPRYSFSIVIMGIGMY
jgi:hypothetical protein